MGHIKEPEGVDFIIQSKPLTDRERMEISNFIKEYKAKHSGKKPKTKSRTSTSKRKILG